jgi:hypothetical protein
MPASAASCPKCGGTAIQGQLVPTRNTAAGVLTTLATDDLAAGLLVAQNGKLVVQAFCLACGAIWLPFREYLVRSARGDFGSEVRDRTRRELEQLVKDGTGFKLMSSETREKSEWAQQILAETKAAR